MSEILVLVEHVDGEVKKVTLELLTLARSLGDARRPSGSGPASPPSAKAKLAEYGAAKIYVADAEEHRRLRRRAEGRAAGPARRPPSRRPRCWSPRTAEGKEIAGRLAVKTDSGVLTDAVGLARRASSPSSPSSAAASTSHSKVTKGTPIVAVRPNSTAPEASAAAPARRSRCR